MKKLFLVASVLLFCASTALATTPETALQLLETGNQKHVMEKALADGGKLAVVVDSNVSADPADVFGIAADKLVVLKPTSSLGDVLGTPLVVVLGAEETSMWNAYAAAVQGSPEIILDILKGKTSVVGAILDTESGQVKILGAHPDLFVLAGQYLHAGETAVAKTEETAAVHGEKTAAAPHEAVVEETAEHHAEDGHAVEGAAAEGHGDAAGHAEGHGEAAAHGEGQGEGAHGESGGGVGATGILLFILALVGTVVFMDKTMWK